MGGLRVWIRAMLLLCALGAIGAAQAAEIKLSFSDNSDNEDGFRIERMVNGGAWATAATLPANVTTWTDREVAPDTTYAYRVFAYNIYGDSDPSNTATITTGTRPAAPGTPTLTITVTATASATIEAPPSPK